MLEQKHADQRAEQIAHFGEILQGLEQRGYSLAVLCEYVFNPATKGRVTDKESTEKWHWRTFFKHKNTVQQIFTHWMSKTYSRTSRETIPNWVFQTVKSTVTIKEASVVTDTKMLQR